MVCVGLFGTCGSSRWREPFIARYQQDGIEFFNPQLPPGQWHPGCIADEHRHLKEDDIFLCPVTDETTAVGSLAEIGFSARQALRSNRSRYFVFFIDPECRAADASPEQIDESNRGRKLVRNLLVEEARGCHNVFLVETLEEMLDLSLKLHRICVEYAEVQTEHKLQNDSQ